MLRVFVCKKILVVLLVLLGFVAIEAQEGGFLEIQTPTYSIVGYQAYTLTTDILLNNGSTWNASSLYVGKTKKWGGEDGITATYYTRANDFWITLKNNLNQESLDVKFVGQTEINAETVFIQDIDLNQSIITLNNGVRYKVQDESKLFGLWVISAKTQLQRWQIGDPVMVLLKAKSNDHILLNTTVAKFGSLDDVVTADYLGE